MKKFALILNIGLLVILGYILVKEGLPHDTEYVLFCLFIFATPLANLLYIYNRHNTTSDNFVSLYFKRRALEEKTKIADLQQKKDKEI